MGALTDHPCSADEQAVSANMNETVWVLNNNFARLQLARDSTRLEKPSKSQSWRNIGLMKPQIAKQSATDDRCHSPNNDVAYYDIDLARKCHKLLNQQHRNNKCTRVLLFPEEEWAKNASGITWYIKINRWLKKTCTVTEQRSTGVQTSTDARVSRNRDGTLSIQGRFKRTADPDFRLHLTALVSRDDYERGYLMTGALQLGDIKGEGRLEITHFAVVSRFQSSVSGYQ